MTATASERVIAEQFHNRSCIFSPDARELICATQSGLFLYSTSTGLNTRILSNSNTDCFEQDNDFVGLLLLQPQHSAKDHLPLASLTSKGRLCFWAVEKSSQAPPVSLDLSLFPADGKAYKFLGFCHGGDQVFYVLCLDEVSQAVVVFRLLMAESKMEKVFEVPNAQSDGALQADRILLPQILYAEAKEMLLLCTDSSLLYALSVKSGKHVKYSHSLAITAFAVDSACATVAFGDSKGVIHHLPLEALESGKVERLAEKFHWHSGDVNALVFSADGQYIYSGGKEGVLVVWQVLTRGKQFVPRVGGPITQICQSQNEFFTAVVTANNAVKVFSSGSLTFCQAVETVGYLGASSLPESCALHTFVPAVRPGSDFVVLPALDGKVQFFNWNSTNHSRFLDISRQNVIYNQENQHNAVVEHVCFCSGELMASVEHREISGIFKSLLKIWTFSADKQVFELSCIFDNAHIGKIGCVAGGGNGASGEFFLTTGLQDCKFRLWQREEKSGKWHCAFVGSYATKEVPSAVSFSPDSSVFVVAYCSILTFWRRNAHGKGCSLAFVHRLTGKTNESIVKTFFLASVPFLVVQTSKRLLIFNLLSLSLWSEQSLFFEPQIFPCSEDKFVMLCKTAGNEWETSVELFSPASIEPISKATIQLRLEHVTFLPTQEGEEVLRFLAVTSPKASKKSSNSTSRLSIIEVQLNEDSSTTPNIGLSSQRGRAEEIFVNSFRSIFGFYEEENSKAQPDNNTSDHSATTAQRFAMQKTKPLDLSAIASMAIPPMDKLCAAYLATLFANKL